MFDSFHLSFFVSFVNEVTKISCHFQAKTVQLIFSLLVILTKIRKTKNVMNRTFEDVKMELNFSSWYPPWRFGGKNQSIKNLLKKKALLVWLDHVGFNLTNLVVFFRLWPSQPSNSMATLLEHIVAQPTCHSSLVDYLAQVKNLKNEPIQSDCVLS